MSDVTRKVIVELGVKLGDVSAVRQLASEAEKIHKATEKTETAEKKAEKTAKTWDQQLGEVRKRITELGDAVAVVGDRWNAGLDEAITKEQLLLKQIEKRNAAIAEAREPVAPKPAPQPTEISGLDDELVRIRKEQTKVADEMARTGKVENTVLDQLTQKEKLLTDQIRKREAALSSARGKMGMGPTGPGLGRQLGEGAERVQAALGKVAIPVTILAFAPQAANEFGRIFNGLSIDLFGTPEERKTGGFFTAEENQKGGRDFWKGFARAGASEWGQRLLRSPTDGGWNPMAWVGGNVSELLLGASAGDIALNEKAAMDAEASRQKRLADQNAEIQLREQQLTAVKAYQEKERSLLDQQIRLAEDKVKTAQAQVDQEKKLLEDARKAYGLLNADEQAALKGAGDKATAGGIGSLNKEELDLVRNNPLFAGLFEKQALQNTAGFDELVRKLGADEKLRKAESDLKLSVEQRNEITVKLDAMDKVVEQLEAKLLPAMEAATLRVIRQAEDGLGSVW